MIIIMIIKYENWGGMQFGEIEGELEVTFD